MCSEIVEMIVNWTAIITFLFFLSGAVFKGIQNLSYVKKSKTDYFKMISKEEAVELLENPLVLDIRSSEALDKQDFHIKFSERIFDLEPFDSEPLPISEAIPQKSFKITKYNKQDIELNTSIIDIEESLIWSAEIREFYSMGKLQWKTATGMIGEFIPDAAAGRERKHVINIVYKHTIRSVMYHFFQR